MHISNSVAMLRSNSLAEAGNNFMMKFFSHGVQRETNFIRLMLKFTVNIPDGETWRGLDKLFPGTCPLGPAFAYKVVWKATDNCANLS